MSNRFSRRVVFGVLLFSLFPGVSAVKGADDLLKSAPASVAPTPDLPQMSPEEMKAVGERATKAAQKLGWRVGCQAWSFNKGTFFQAVDQVNALGLHYIEAFPNQAVSDQIKGKIGPGLNPEERTAVKKKLADAGVMLGSYGVVGFPKQEAEARKLLEWAQEMGIETIVSEPDFDQVDMIDKLTNEYGIKLAIHNHPGPKNRYWNPDTELKMFEGRSKMIGSCSDVGHWQRSGVQPIEALKKLEGRIIETHFKDLNKFGETGAVDVPWGTGTGNAKGMLDEFKRQGAKFTFLVEYENWKPTPPQRVQQIAHSIEFFGKTCEQLAGDKK